MCLQASISNKRSRNGMVMKLIWHRISIMLSTFRACVDNFAFGFPRRTCAHFPETGLALNYRRYRLPLKVVVSMEPTGEGASPARRQLQRQYAAVELKARADSFEQKKWEEATCPVCMEPPHNAVLLICSSYGKYGKGCRPYVCDTSYRHSNCLDQYRMGYELHQLWGAPPFFETKRGDGDGASGSGMTMTSGSGDGATTTGGGDGTGSSGMATEVDAEELLCPLCRGKVKGWKVVEAACNHLNQKVRLCSQESCDFEGPYEELRKHARCTHPSARPSEIDPNRLARWMQLERQRELGDMLSMLGAMVLGDDVNEGDDGGDDEDVDDTENLDLVENTPLIVVEVLLKLMNSNQITEELLGCGVVVLGARGWTHIPFDPILSSVRDRGGVHL